MIIQYEKTFQGAHKFYAMVGEHLVTRQYFFTSKREALRDFKNAIAPKCKKCGSKLSNKNVSEGYAWVCNDCDEDFYDMEAVYA